MGEDLPGRTDCLSTDHLMESLGKSAGIGAKRTIYAQLVKIVLQVVSIVVLARLLSPEEFGLVAMATVLTALLAPLTDGGLSMATIQRREITQVQVSNLFWVNCLLGAFLCFVVALSAPLVVWLFGEPRLLPVILVLSPVFLLIAVSVQSSALLKRQMRYGAIAVTEVTSMAVGIVSGIFLAFAGSGHWALVMMTLVTTCAASLMLVALCGWAPSKPASRSGLWPLLHFGLNVTGADFVGRASSALTPFAVGFFGGPAQLGLFNRAQTIVSLPTSQILPLITTVAQPALARVADDPPRFARALNSLLKKALIPSVFVTLIIAVQAEWLVIVVLGAEWTESVSFIRLLSIFALVEPVASIVSAAMIANGFPGAMLRWRLISFVIIFASAVVGSNWGATGIVTAIALSGISLRLFGFLYYAGKYLPLSAASMVRVFLPYILIIPVMVTWLLAAQHLLGGLSSLIALLISSVVSVALYIALIFAVPETRTEARSILTTLVSTGTGSKKRI